MEKLKELCYIHKGKNGKNYARNTNGKMKIIRLETQR